MFKFLRRHRTLLMVSLIVVIGGLTLFGLGGSFFNVRVSPHDAILKVNGVKVTQGQFDHLFNQLIRQQQGTLTPEDRKKLMGETLNEVLRLEVFSQEAEKYGIEIPDQELQLHLQSYPSFQTEGRFDPSLYARTLYQVLNTTPRDFENSQRKVIASRKISQLIASAVQVPDDVVTELLPQRLAIETDKKKKKDLSENPEILRDEIRNREANVVMQDWLGQLNAGLKINFVSELFKKRLSGAAE